MSTPWQPRPHDAQIEKDHLDRRLDPLVARLLAQRGVTAGNADLFFHPRVDMVNWAESLDGIKDAAKLLLATAKKKGRVAVIGDYDADGTLSSAMLKLLCDELGIECYVFLPSRLEHGYGLNAKTVPAFMKAVGEPPDLLIAADCGTSSGPEVEALRKFGAKRIAIIDHHIADPKRFAAGADLVVNWRLGSGQELCTAGEVFVLAKTLEGMLGGRNFTRDTLLPLAAIATVTDECPVVGLNRIIVKNGLTHIGRTTLPGLKQLVERCECLTDEGVTQSDVNFQIGPRLNAVGRMGKADPSYDLMITKDVLRASALVDELDSTNNERKLLLAEMTEQAIEMVKAQGLDKYQGGILLSRPDWHVGIVGVVASRIVDRYWLPTIIMGSVDGKVKGSGRSVTGVNLKAIMDSCAEMFEVYGGHEMAAGATLVAGREATATQDWNRACEQYFATRPRPQRVQYYDAELEPERVSVQLCNLLRETLYPYHRGGTNPEPVFLMREVEVTRTKMNNGDTWRLLSFEGRKGGRALPLWFKSFNKEHHDLIEGQTIDVLFKCAQSWKPRWGPSLEVVALQVVGQGVEWDVAPEAPSEGALL